DSDGHIGDTEPITPDRIPLYPLNVFSSRYHHDIFRHPSFPVRRRLTCGRKGVTVRKVRLVTLSLLSLLKAVRGPEDTEVDDNGKYVELYPPNLDLVTR
ncbi:Hypothetical predicted protein, partial [Marmota monax]